ncbi:MAG: DUF362 domain-containing protein [Candidatus Cloacimonetes bacterium]|nr:DUF362 domain-containing protein [Candidatus Cloacimonadota bacterium]
MAKVQIRRIASYELPLLEAAVADFLSHAHRLRMKRSKRVLLKPNLLGNFPPERGVTTNPLVMEALVRHFLDLGKEVWIGDSPGGTVNVDRVWETSGMADLAKRYPVKLVNLSTAGFRELQSGEFSVKISEIFWKCGIVVNVAKYKTHGLVGFTGALKNLYGLVPGLAKSNYHSLYPNSLDFSKLLLALYALTRSRLSYNIIDGIQGMDGLGPSGGRTRNFGLLFGSRSVSALDYVAATMMGFAPDDVPYLEEALRMDGILPSRIGVPTSFHGYVIPDADLRAVRFSNRFLRRVPRSARHLMERLYYKRPVISNRCRKCEICVQSCPVQVITPADKFNFPEIDPKACIRCLCCHEMCPHDAIDIHKSLLVKMVER